MTKDIVGRLRKIATTGVFIHKADCGIFAEAADLIESLSPPDGVGLTRYVISAVMLKSEPVLLVGAGPVGPYEGDWVRYEDAAAALAAEKARGDGLHMLGTPLVRERSAVQSCAAAPVSPGFSGMGWQNRGATRHSHPWKIRGPNPASVSSPRTERN